MVMMKVGWDNGGMLDNDDDDDFVGVGVFGIESGVVLLTEDI